MSPSGQGKTVLPLCSRQGGSRLPKPSPEQTREPEMVEAQLDFYLTKEGGRGRLKSLLCLIILLIMFP